MTKPGYKFLRVFDREFYIVETVDERQAVRILEKVIFPENDDDNQCWLWSGARNAAGYGYVSWGPSGSSPAHRVVWSILVEPPTRGHHLHHLCENRCCVNPFHLEEIDPVSHVDKTPRNICHDNKGRSHCVRGHPLEGGNLYISPEGKRRCRQCLREWANKKNAQKREERDRSEEWKHKQMHCRSGHLMNEANTYTYAGIKFCRKCHNINSKKYYNRRREELIAVREQYLKRKKKVPEDLPQPHNADKTHCSRGHEFTPENTYVRKTGKKAGSRRCLICMREEQRAAYKRKREKILAKRKEYYQRNKERILAAKSARG